MPAKNNFVLPILHMKQIPTASINKARPNMETKTINARGSQSSVKAENSEECFSKSCTLKQARGYLLLTFFIIKYSTQNKSLTVYPFSSWAFMCDP